ncbi:hypothetical protein FV227_05125 [Methylobacterium sp. WL119]|uniref:hypothetical protein n=2 Tax=Methylobacterium TaxID=407 RepID=UPI0011CB2E64|nr:MULTISPECIES: hypothetical protein [unclassified Methylobacterium]TXN26160.1 hypothetical protein FV225_23750 [Methylobacterium sp. WL93]TXN52149.1 hypothetical protein FV227_05125 [Methylobacterium sp. WL119]
MRNSLKCHPNTDPKPTLREWFAAMKAKASTLNAGKDRRPDATAFVPPASSAVSAAIHEHLRAYAGRLYAEVYKTEDAGSRAEQERDAFRAVLHTPLASDAERLAYAKAVIERAAGVHGLECYGNTRGAWMPTAYRNIAFGEYVPEPDMVLPEPDASEPVASDLGGQGVALAH